MHKRQQIREALKTLLISNTNAGANVYSNRVSAFWRSELPSISIFTTEEEASPRDLSGKQHIRKMTLNIEVHAEAKEDLDVVLDDIANQIEEIITDNQSISSTCLSCQMQGTNIELAGEPSTPIGVLAISYQVTYIK